MDPYSIFAWIVFYLVIVTLFYWCFRQSMSAVSSNSSTSNTRTAPHSETNNHLANRMADLHNMYTVTDETNRNASDQHQPPPEYKWEDLPPSYEEAVAGSHSNPAFEQHEASTSASAGEATELSLTSPAQSA
ncbi:hypothetical protein GHT06_017449 [Daphnia sinensis]|uniref:Uncharacterized protein n=1 Tax=Daphnia sinensis TaxID=1820382 RepID=A0AAD5L7P1_9CRUS|nr:hypothetical protein GHT06_017449 [Daphnia sinensis]